MIDRLRKKIFWIIQISLISIMLGIIIIYSILNYKNVINSSVMMVERVIEGDIRREERLDEIEPKILQGIYIFSIDNNLNILKKSQEVNTEIENYAIKVSKRKKENGIIGKYIYKVRRMRNNEIKVILIENENIISHIKEIWVLSIIAGIIAIVVIYVIAKKVSKTIVKPVEETIEKQKQFISDASHELKTPLSVIEANIDVIEDEVGKNKWIEYIQSEIESMNKLVNDLLLLAKMENTVIKESNKFNISEEVEKTTSIFESIAYEKKIKLNTKIQKDIPFEGDKEDIKHILSILIDNGIKHTEENRNVIVELSKEKNEIKLEVKNEGKPIPNEEQKRIFERFYRVDKSRNRDEKRYGLGLAIAKQIIEKYKGTIEVNCNNEITNFIVKFHV